jgi:hypothetical protein
MGARNRLFTSTTRTKSPGDEGEVTEVAERHQVTGTATSEDRNELNSLLPKRA